MEFKFSGADSGREGYCIAGDRVYLPQTVTGEGECRVGIVFIVRQAAVEQSFELVRGKDVLSFEKIGRSSVGGRGRQ